MPLGIQTKGFIIGLLMGWLLLPMLLAMLTGRRRTA